MKASFLKILILTAIVTFWKAGQKVQAQDEAAVQVMEKLEQMLETIAGYDYDSTRQWQQGFQDLMKLVYRDPDLRDEAEKMMTEFLRSDATKAGKQIICRELGIIGSEISVSVLSEMLSDPAMSETALMALGKIPGDAADRALRNALQLTRNGTRIAVINAIAVRKDMQAVQQLEKICRDRDREMAGAAIAALGNLGSPACAGILEGLFRESDETLKWETADAWMKCADNLMQADETAMAHHIYSTVYDAGPPLPLKNAALRGMFLTSGEDPCDFIARHLKSEDPGFHREVIGLIALIRDPENLGRLITEVPDLPEGSRIYLIITLAGAGDFSARPAILEALEQGEQSVRISAIKALPEVGWPSDAMLLAVIAAGKQGAEREAARSSLDILAAGGTNDSIMAAIGQSEGKVKAELIRSTGERNMTGAVNLLLGSVYDQDLNVSLESVRALGKLAPPELISELAEILLHAESPRVRMETERAVLSLIQKLPSGADRSGVIIKVLSSAGETAPVISLVTILGQIGDRKDLPILQGYLESENEEVQIATIKALSGWPDSGPAPDLLKMVKSADDQRKHTLALRGYIEVMVSDDQLSAAEKLGGIKTAWGFVSGDSEKKSILSGLGRIHSLEALDLALGMMKEPEIRNEAETAAIIIAGETSWSFPAETKERLQILLDSSVHEEHRERAERILERIQ